MDTDTRKLLSLFALPVALCLLWTTTTTVRAANDEGFSAANRALFLARHLQNLDKDKPQTLVYDVEQTGSAVEWFKDTITLRVKPLPKEHQEATVEYMTGERNRWTPPFNDPGGNPVLLLFLQSDIHEMERLNGGQWRHFQKYIKLALENGATLEDTSFEFADKTRHGQKISIQPYREDPEKDKFAEKAYVQKRYDFILSDEVPGGLYQILAYVPADANSDGKPVASRQLRLRTVGQ